MAVYSKGMQASYSEADNSAMKLEPIKFLGLSSDVPPYQHLDCWNPLFYEAML